MEAVVLLTWMTFTAGGCWVIWRLAYDQGRDDGGTGACCRGGDHDHPEIPVPTPDEWDRVIAEILDQGPSDRTRRATLN